MEAAKAVAGLLKPGNSVMDHLEGVGPERPYAGPSTPFIAVPTTARTGSEVTKNAVLSISSPQGFKKSFRHERLVPEHAAVDPDLLAPCPPPLIAANGMDAFTQLLESFMSTTASPFADALALSAMAAVRDGLLAWYEGTPGAAVDGRERMAYTALASGITLAQTGLGSVHGLAAPLGAFFPIAHGVTCGTLLAAANPGQHRSLRSPRPGESSPGEVCPGETGAPEQVPHGRRGRKGVPAAHPRMRGPAALPSLTFRVSASHRRTSPGWWPTAGDRA